MHMLFLDDSKQRRPVRNRLGPLVAVGGISIDSRRIRRLESELNRCCREEYGFPEREVFKWSPSRDHWFREGLTGDRRTQFFIDIVRKCLAEDARFFVAAVESNRRPATGADDPEIDALILTMERFHTAMSPEDNGMIFVAKPAGGTTDEASMLSHCVDTRANGTGFVRFEKIALDVISVPFNHSRVLQVADIVVSITTAMIAGYTDYADPVFSVLKDGFQRNAKGQIGGTGVKLHPSYLRNLYHWVCGDEYYSKGISWFPLPQQGFVYANDSGLG